MALPPKTPDRLPSLEHEGIAVEVVRHYGFTTPARGNSVPRIIYGARNPEDNERHWRSSYDEITSLIDHGFVVASGTY